uniref:Uncharacterized protein n=1 Tax=Megaselia scalaris TaxID=36166 RepID=T1GV18_MEGSC
MCKKTPKLKSIEIYDCKLNDKLINFLKVAGNLESLNIVRCSRFNNDVFNEIPKYCKSLKTLKIGTTYSGWNLQKVAEIENLENLTIQHTDVYLKEEIIKDLSVKKADQMKEFHLILSKFQKSNETDLNNVLKFKNLENLTLQGFKDMKNDHSLRGISLAYNTELTQAGILKFIEACPLLTQIDLTHCILGTDFSEELFNNFLFECHDIDGSKNSSAVYIKHRHTFSSGPRGLRLEMRFIFEMMGFP